MWVRIGTLECALVSRREFDPRHDLAIYFDTIASASAVFDPFFKGVKNSNNPVKVTILMDQVHKSKCEI